MARKHIEDPWNRERKKKRSSYFPFLLQNILLKELKKKANINFCNSYKLNSREKNPWSATRPLVSNQTESLRWILICFRGHHQSHYPPDLCHCINQTLLCNSFSVEEMWQKLKMNRQTSCRQTIKYLSNVSNAPEMHPLKGIRFYPLTFIQQEEKAIIRLPQPSVTPWWTK